MKLLRTSKEDFSIDAIDMKRSLQEKFYEDTQGLSAKELIEYIHRQIADSEFADFLSDEYSENS
jgi:hypothetical protein